MPTSRPRIQLTLTDRVDNALRTADSLWPDAARAEQITRLMEAGAAAVQDRSQAIRRRRREAADTYHGALGGVYGKDYLEELRRDWPQ